jgi:hypothetical protein
MPRKFHKNRQVVISSDPDTQKIVRIIGPPKLEDGHLAWRFSKSDNDGPYRCGVFEHDEFKQLWDKLQAFENMNMAEFARADSFHKVSTLILSKDAKKRLQEIHLDDLDSLYSFHIVGACRLWCMKHGNIMCVLWWDKNHEVYQVEKKHT